MGNLDLEAFTKRGGTTGALRVKMAERMSKGSEFDGEAAGRQAARDIEHIDIDRLPEEGALAEIPLDRLHVNPFQPRRHIDEDSLMELAASIKMDGVIQPISVSIGEDGKLYVVAGHRRMMASKLAGVKTIRAILHDKVSNAKLRSIALVENLQREEMSNIEAGLAMKDALESGDYKNQSALAKSLGKQVSYVSKAIKLLTLPERVITDLIKNRSTDDIVALDAIRKINNMTDAEEIYFWFIEKKVGRQQLAERIAALGNNKTAPESAASFVVHSTPKSTNIEIPVKLSKKQTKALESFLEELLKK